MRMTLRTPLIAAALLMSAALSGCIFVEGSGAPGVTPEPAPDMPSTGRDMETLPPQDLGAQPDMREPMPPEEDAGVVDQGVVPADMPDMTEPDMTVPIDADMSDLEDAGSPDIAPPPCTADACPGDSYCDTDDLGGTGKCLTNPCLNVKSACTEDDPQQVIQCDEVGGASQPVSIIPCMDDLLCHQGSCQEPCSEDAADSTRCKNEKAVERCQASTEDASLFFWMDGAECEDSQGCSGTTGKCEAHECSEKELSKGFGCSASDQVFVCEKDNGQRIRTMFTNCGDRQVCDPEAAGYTQACVCRHECASNEARCTGMPANMYQTCEKLSTGCRVWSSNTVCAQIGRLTVLGCQAPMSGSTGGSQELTCNATGTCAPNSMSCTLAD